MDKNFFSGFPKTTKSTKILVLKNFRLYSTLFAIILVQVELYYKGGATGRAMAPPLFMAIIKLFYKLVYKSCPPFLKK